MCPKSPDFKSQIANWQIDPNAPTDLDALCIPMLPPLPPLPPLP